jgi:hypothetical protein
MAEVSSGGERKRMSGCNGDTLRRDALKRTDSAVCGRVISCSRGLASIVRYNFPVRGDMPEVKFTWYDGGLKPARPPEELEENCPLKGDNEEDEGLLAAKRQMEASLGR